MFGRKKYPFYPHGGIEHYQYDVPIINDNYFIRQQPSNLFPLPLFPPQGNQNWYQNQLPYNMGPDNYVNGYPNLVNSNQIYAGQPNMMNQGFSTSVLQNPLQPVEQPYQKFYPQQVPRPTSFNQYPNQAFIPKQPSGMKTIINSFKAQDGSVDINKMVNTAGQMVNAVTQVSSMIKGLGGIIKT